MESSDGLKLALSEVKQPTPAALDDPAAYVAGRLRRLLRVVVACLDVNCNGKIDRVDLQKAGEKGVPWARVLKERRERALRTGQPPAAIGGEVDEFVFH